MTDGAMKKATYHKSTNRQKSSELERMQEDHVALDGDNNKNQDGCSMTKTVDEVVHFAHEISKVPAIQGKANK